MRSLCAKSPAKINLYLRVLGLRSDGYHEIETIYQAIDLYDELIITESAGHGTLDVPGYPELETQNNLVLHARRWIESELNQQFPVNMTLIKHIPEAAGLGGGSSNAAAALLGMRDLFDLNLGDNDLSRAALSLGADVPFFLKGGTAVGEGIGERLTPVTLDYNYTVLLVNPGFRAATRSVYSEFSKGLTGPWGEGKVWKLLGAHHGLEELFHNDLQPACERLYPETSFVRRTLDNLGLKKTLVTGSGPTVFGTDHRDQLNKIADSISGKWKGFIARPIQQGVIIS